MKLITFSTAFALWLLAGFYTQAQENDHDTKTAVERLNSLKEQIIQEEKDALKFSVENINKRFESGNITEAEAEILKQEVAEKHALNIENRLAIIDNKVALLQRNGNIDEDEDGQIILRFGSSGKDSENDNVLYIGPKNKSANMTEEPPRTLSLLLDSIMQLRKVSPCRTQTSKLPEVGLPNSVGHGRPAFLKTPIGYALSMVYLFNLMV